MDPRIGCLWGCLGGNGQKKAYVGVQIRISFKRKYLLHYPLPHMNSHVFFGPLLQSKTKQRFGCIITQSKAPAIAGNGSGHQLLPTINKWGFYISKCDDCLRQYPNYDSVLSRAGSEKC